MYPASDPTSSRPPRPRDFISAPKWGDEAQLQRPDLHPLRPDGRRGLRERAGLAGDEHEVQARVGEPVGERGADPLRAARDDGLRAVLVDLR